MQRGYFFRRLLFDRLLDRRAGRDEASIDKDCSASTLLPRRRGGDGERPPDYKLRGYRQSQSGYSHGRGLENTGFFEKDCETIKFCEKLEGSFSAATTGGDINFIFYFFCLVKTEKVYSLYSQIPGSQERQGGAMAINVAVSRL